MNSVSDLLTFQQCSNNFVMQDILLPYKNSKCFIGTFNITDNIIGGCEENVAELCAAGIGKQNFSASLAELDL